MAAKNIKNELIGLSSGMVEGIHWSKLTSLELLVIAYDLEIKFHNPEQIFSDLEIKLTFEWMIDKKYITLFKPIKRKAYIDKLSPDLISYLYYNLNLDPKEIFEKIKQKTGIVDLYPSYDLPWPPDFKSRVEREMIIWNPTSFS